MNKTILAVLSICLLASCNGWVIQPGNVPTPFLALTSTPSIYTATPAAAPTLTSLPFITATSVPVLPTDTPIPFSTPTTGPSGPAVSVEILGCNTSIDVTHGMGEVTNAFVVLRNTGGVELTNLRVTLNALDEGREHPDKTVEVPTLPAGYKVTLKLTVDSTYRAETPVQVEVSADGGLFQRVGAESCKDIGVFAPDPGGLTTPGPINP